MSLSRLIGSALRPVRAGTARTFWAKPAAQAPETITLFSEDFHDGGPMPERCAGPGVGENVPPALRWSSVPADAKELVLIVEDPDAPLPSPVVHLVALGIDPEKSDLASAEHSGVVFGRGFLGKMGYTGPRPVPGHGRHHYLFQLYALSAPTGLGAGAGIEAVLAALSGKVLARGRLIGTYER